MPKNSIEIIKEEGRINIANDIIMTIAEHTAKEIDGIVSIKRGVPRGVLEYFNKGLEENKPRDLENEPVIINLSLVLKYGFIIPETVARIQEKIRRDVKAMTDISVARVNIFVGDIVME